MASSESKEVAIYRCTNAGDTEHNLPDKEALGMDYGATDGSDVAVVLFNWNPQDRRTDVPIPSVRALSKPDTGIANLALTIGVLFNEKDTDSVYSDILTAWGIDSKTTVDFQKGRFGIRNNKKLACNFQPTKTAGWKIVDIDFDDDLKYGGKFDVVITLEYAGQISEILADINSRIP